MPRKREKNKETVAAQMRRADKLLPRVPGLFSRQTRARLHRWWVYFSLKLHIRRDNPERNRRF